MCVLPSIPVNIHLCNKKNRVNSRTRAKKNFRFATVETFAPGSTSPLSSCRRRRPAKTDRRFLRSNRGLAQRWKTEASRLDAL